MSLTHPSLGGTHEPARHARRRSAFFGWCALLPLALAGCIDKSPGPAPAQSDEPSPNASIYPAPLESAQASVWSDDAGLGGDPDAAVKRELATWMREDQPLPPDTLNPKEAQGFTLEARFAWPAPAGSAEGPLASLRQRLGFGLAIDLSPAGRMRMVLSGAPFVLPRGTELRARFDRYGHVLVWPDGQSYRVLQPGTLRAVLAERRCDAGPLVPGELGPVGATTVLGLPARRAQITSPLGTLTLITASVPGSARAGVLVCRTLLELAGVDPASPACAEEQVPMRADFAWTRGGRLGFEVTSVLKPRELPPAVLRAPPDNPHFKGDLLPPEVPRVLVSPPDLAVLRPRDTPSTEADGGVPPDAVTTAQNETNMPLYLLLEGVPLAWVRPGTGVRLPGLRRGRYTVTWRDFFGHDPEPTRALDLPGPIEVGAADAGAAPP